ncbi:MAG: hypothetical protein L0H76_13170 [Brevibacterium sp.]|nr:hypothetical protein [Brevibacterium sp.]
MQAPSHRAHHNHLFSTGLCTAQASCIAFSYSLMQFISMYKIMTTQQILRLGFTHLGFTHKDILRARRCCVRRLSRGVYSVRHVCTVEGHRPLWASIAEGTHSEFTQHGDIRDEIEELDAAVMARCEVRFQKQGRQKLRKEAAGSPEPTTTAQSSLPSASPPAEVFSHISAALIHGLPIAYPVTHQVEVVRPGVNRRFKSIHVRGGTIPRHHRQAVRGTEVTTLERTLIDVARTYNPDISVSMFDDALRRGLTTREKILQTLAQCLEIRNTKKVSLALDLADGRRESPAESIAAVRFFQHGFAGFVPQVEFDAAALRTKVRVDFCHAAARLIVEIDGIGKLYLGSGCPVTSSSAKGAENNGCVIGTGASSESAGKSYSRRQSLKRSGGSSWARGEFTMVHSEISTLHLTRSTIDNLCGCRNCERQTELGGSRGGPRGTLRSAAAWM